MTMRPVNVPVPVAIVAGATTAVTWIMTLIGGLTTGVSWDEPYRVGKLANLLEHGWFVDNVADGQPVDFNTYVYAPVYDLVSHAFATLLVTHDWAQVSVAADAYAARHLSLALLAGVGMVAVGSIAAMLLGGWRWGLVATALLGAIPLWTGHAMFNSSDLPVAVGYTLVTLSVLLITRRVQGLPRRSDDRHTQSQLATWAPDLAWAAILAVGASLAIGTRPATWPALAVSAVIALVGVAAVAGRRWAVGLAHALLSVGVAMVVTFAVLALTYPSAFANPMEALVESIGQSAQFGGEAAATAAMPLTEALGYLPSWLRIQLPIGVTILSLVGIVVAVVMIVNAGVGRARGRSLDWRTIGVAAVLAQVIVLPLGAALARSNLYDSGRQFLFLVPALAVLAGVGAWALLAWVSRARWGRRAWQTAAWVLVGISAVMPVIDQVRMFPYNYTYANELASPLNDRIPTDYWRTSMRELMPLVPADGPTACNFDPLILGLVPIDCANAGQIAPYLHTRGSESIGVPVPPGKYLFLSSNRGRATLPPESGCTVIDRVTRPLHGEDVVMSYVALCEAPCVVQEAAQCSGKSMVASNLDGWNLRGSDFSGADFSRASLIFVNFTDADLAGANLTGANIDQADFTGANLAGVTATDLVGTPAALPPDYRLDNGTLVRDSATP